jgi:hypothetical protein
MHKQKAGDPSSNLDPTDRLDAPDEVDRSCNGLAFRPDDADRNSRRLRLLGNGRISERKAQKSGAKRLAHFRLPLSR